MLSFLNGLINGWRELRTTQGNSYQVSRGGKRRVVAVDQYGRRGEIDHQWLATGEFTEEQIRRRFRDYNLARVAHRIPTRLTPLQAVSA